MKKHFEIIDHNAFIVWEERKEPEVEAFLFRGTLYWNYSDMEDSVVYEWAIPKLEFFDKGKELSREVLLRKYKHKSLV